MAAPSDRLQQFAFGREFHELHVVPVGEPNETLGVEPDGVGEPENARTPGEKKFSPAIENDNRMIGAAIEAINAIESVNRDRGRFHVHTDGHMRPVLMHLVCILSGAYDRFHRLLPWSVFGLRGCVNYPMSGALVSIPPVDLTYGDTLAGVGLGLKDRHAQRARTRRHRRCFTLAPTRPIAYRSGKPILETRPMLELYHGLVSTASERIRLVLEEKGLPWISHPVDLFDGGQHRPEYRDPQSYGTGPDPGA